MLFGEHRQRTVGSHGGHRLDAVPGHGQDHGPILLVGVAVSLLELRPLLLRIALHPLVGDFQILKLHQVGVQPFPVGLPVDITVFQGFVVHDLPLHRVHQKHLSGAEPLFFHHVLHRDLQSPHLGGEDHVAVLRHAVPGGP